VPPNFITKHSLLSYLQGVINMKIIAIKIVLGFLGILIAALSALLIIVDGVAIIFTYVSLIFALFSIGAGSKGILKIYCAIFLLAHLIFGWRMNSDTTASNISNSNYPTEFKIFR